MGFGNSLGFDVTRINEPLGGVQSLTPGNVTLTDADGTRQVFKAETNGSFTEPPGVQLRLRQLPPGDVQKAWSMTKPDGTVRYFSQAGFLTSIVDRRSNEIRLQYERYSKLEGDTTHCDQTSPVSTPTAADLLLLCTPRVTRIVDPTGVSALKATPVDNDVVARRSVVFSYANQPLLSGTAAAEVAEAKTAIANLTGAQQQRAALFSGSSGRITRITDHAGRRTDFGYTPGGYLNRLAQGDVTTGSGTDTASHREFGFDYESSGSPRRLIRVMDPNLLADGRMPNATAGTRISYGSTACASGGDPQAAQRVAGRIDRRGRATSYCYSQSGDSTHFEARAPTVSGSGSATTSYDLDARGRPTLVSDPLSRRVAYAWDDATTNDNNPITRTVQPGNAAEEAVTKWEFDKNGLVRKQTDPMSHVTTYDYCYSQSGSSTICTDASPSADVGSREVADLTKVTRPVGDSVKLGRNTFGELTSRQYSDEAASMKWAYDANGRMLSETDERNRRTDYSSFDESGLPRQIANSRATGAASTDTVGRARRWAIAYDAVGNRLRQIDPRAGTTTTDPSAPTTAESRYATVAQYDAFNRPTRVDTPRGDDTSTRRSTAYDDNGNVTSTTDGKGKVTQYSWTPTDKLETQVTPEVAHVDGAGTKTSGTETTRWSYDAHDNVAKLESPNGTATSTINDWSTAYSYDNADQLKSEAPTSVDGGITKQNVTSYDYDGRGNMVSVTDPRGGVGDRRWRFEYDKADNQTLAIEAPDNTQLALRTERDYDANDRMWKERPPRYWEKTDPAERAKFETTTLYNARDNRSSVTRGDRATLFCYWADGQIDTIRSPRAAASNSGPCSDASVSAGNFVTKFTYDSGGDLASRKLPSAGLAHEANRKAMTYTRDPVGDPVTITDYRGRTATQTFFATGELKSTTRPWMWSINPAADADRDGAEITERPWEEWSREQQSGASPDLPSGDFGATRAQGMPPLEPRAGLTTFDYDGEMRLQSVKDVAEPVTGQVTKINRDDVGRVSSIERPLQVDKGGASTTTTTAFGFDRNGQQVQTTQQQSGAAAEDLTTTTSFDQFGRRISETAPGAARSVPATGTEPDEAKETTSWTYDANDNLKSKTAPTGAVTSYTFDRVDRRTSIQAPLGRTRTFGYDAAGNVTCEHAPRGNTALAETCGDSPYTTWSAYTPYDELLQRKINPDVGAAMVWDYKYDADGDRTEALAPGAQADVDGSVQPQKTEYGYDGRGLRWSTTTDSRRSGEAKRTTVTEYDFNGNLRRTVEPRGVDQGADPPKPKKDDATQGGSPTADMDENATVNSYNDDNQVLQVWLPHSDITVADDPSTDADDEDKIRYVSVRTYDTRGRLRSVGRPYESGKSAPRQATYGYLETGWIGCTSREATVAADCDNATSAAGQGTPVAGEIRYSYDRRGLQTGWAAGARESTRTYYGNGLLKKRTATISTTDTRTRSYRYAWTGNHDLADIHDVQEERRWHVTRDAADRVTEVNETGAGDRDTAYSYDLGDNVRTRNTDGVFTGSGSSRTYTGGKTATFDYDSVDRETSVEIDPEQGSNRITQTVWFPSGDKSSRRRGKVTYVPKPNAPGQTDRVVELNNLKERWFTDADGRPSRHQRYAGDDSAPAYRKNRAYEYDRNGNRTKDEQGVNVFDSRDRLTQNTDADGTQTRYWLNGSGSIRQKQTAGRYTTYTYSRDLLTCVQYYSAKPAADAPTCPTNEAAALPTGQEGWTKVTYNALRQTTLSRTKLAAQSASNSRYGYDAFGRLTGQQPKDNAKITRFTYDGLDRRELKCAADAAKFSGSVTEDSTFDRTCPDGDLSRSSYVGLSERLSAETRSTRAGSTQTQNERRMYDYDANLAQLGQDRVDGSAVKYRSYSFDARGSVEELDDPDGQRVAGYRYDPYGATKLTGVSDTDTDTSGDGAANPFRFEGFYGDDGLDTYDMQARSYQPDTGRFLTADEYEDASADTGLETDMATQDRYGFGGGNPVNSIESDGHKAGTEPFINTDGSVNERGRPQGRDGKRVPAQKAYNDWQNSRRDFVTQRTGPSDASQSSQLDPQTRSQPVSRPKPRVTADTILQDLKDEPGALLDAGKTAVTFAGCNIRSAVPGPDPSCDQGQQARANEQISAAAEDASGGLGPEVAGLSTGLRGVGAAIRGGGTSAARGSAALFSRRLRALHADQSGSVGLGRAPEYYGGRVTESGALRSAINYLGDGYNEVKPGRFVSSDSRRVVRYGPHEVRGSRHHIHFEALDSSGRVTENTSVDIIP